MRGTTPSLAGPAHRGALRRSCPPTACGRLLLDFALQDTPARQSGGWLARGDNSQMQEAIRTLVSLGPLPASSQADVDHLRRVESALADVHTPLKESEAKALLTVFGPDDCFGLAWSFVHLIETAPDLSEVLASAAPSNEWTKLLRNRRS